MSAARPGRHVVRRALVAMVAAVTVLLATAPAATAHPLGNLSSNSSAGVTLGPQRTDVTYVLDLAEIPAFQARQQMGEDPDAVTAVQADDWGTRRCRTIGDALLLQVEGRATDLSGGLVDLTFPAGEAGLVTLRLTCEFSAQVALRRGDEVTLVDANDLGRAGWREVIVDGDGLEVSADVPATSRSDRLRSYPEGVTPLRVTQATAVIGTTAVPGESSTSRDDGLDPITRAIEGLTSTLTDLVARESFTLPFAVLAVVLATIFGAFHALAPGHGKTVMAAYLVSRRGTTRQAIGLGLTTAATHTIGVLVLGTILTATQAFAPADLYPYLGLSSGLLFLGIGGVLLRRSLLNRGHVHGHGPGQHTHAHVDRLERDLAVVGAHVHDHVDGHVHEHEHVDGHDHDHGHGPTPPDEATALTTWRSMVLPGLAGGMVPSPSALVVLIGGIALGRTWFGIVLVAAYGLGMAATLVAAGYALTRARSWVEERSRDSGRFGRVAVALPVVTAAVVVVGGALLTLRSLSGLL